MADAVADAQQRYAGRPDAEVVVHDGAGHAFESSFHPMFSSPDATAASSRQTLAFLGRTLEP